MIRLISCTPEPEKQIIYIARVSNPKNQDNPDIAGLIRYLVKHRHWSPFEHAFMTVEIHTNRAIAVQLLRHRSFTFQEFSQRYSEIEWLQEWPEMRAKAAKNRQSSSQPMEVGEVVERALTEAYESYLALREMGVANECARMVLPMCTPTRLYMSGTIRSWLHYVDLRCQSDTQKEHREIAEAVKAILAGQCPITMEAINEGPTP